tara:strand:+ start:373 stop:480 length:108 start_codon:yes stop_codon:yes gene_type:complete
MGLCGSLEFPVKGRDKPKREVKKPKKKKDKNKKGN